MKCEYCEKEFEGPRKKKYCSNECCRAADRDNKRIRYVGKRQPQCIQCGCELPKFKTKFCSRRCEQIYDGILLDHGELTKICPVCGKEFKTWKSQKITCSEECSKYRGKNLRKRTPEQERERYRAKHPGARSMDEIHREHLAKVEQTEAKKAAAAKKQEKARKKKAKLKQERIAYWNEYCQMHVCQECGQMYVAYYPLSKFCSDKCRSRHQKHTHSYKKRYKGITVDKDISLRALALRDDDVCQICGLKVSWDDWVLRDGIIICGDYYPSIDHIRPISKGGLHSWDNVQLAHRRCNTYKSDNIIS